MKLLVKSISGNKGISGRFSSGFKISSLKNEEELLKEELALIRFELFKFDDKFVDLKEFEGN